MIFFGIKFGYGKCTFLDGHLLHYKYWIVVQFISRK